MFWKRATRPIAAIPLVRLESLETKANLWTDVYVGMFVHQASPTID
jgi:hypothetical protein